MKNWKTTTAGVMAIATSVIALYYAWQNKAVTAEVVLAAIAGVMTGIGLLTAKDNNVTGGTTQQ